MFVSLEKLILGFYWFYLMYSSYIRKCFILWVLNKGYLGNSMHLSYHFMWLSTKSMFNIFNINSQAFLHPLQHFQCSNQIEIHSFWHTKEQYSFHHWFLFYVYCSSMEMYFCNAVICEILHGLVHSFICLAFWANNMYTCLVIKCEN